jgi:hypothetical protein
MWSQNIDTKQWTRQEDTLPKQDYELLKQELEKTRYYSKCLHGTTYLPINRLDDAYDILGYTNESGYYVGIGTSPYAPAVSAAPYEIEINNSTNDAFTKYKAEYGHTLKNLFTPEKIIDESVKNYVFVDVATTDAIPGGLTGQKINLVIDGIRIREGHRILVKNQKTFVVLSNFVDPDTYFTGNYYINRTDALNTEYYYFGSDNGIYIYKDRTLVRESDLDTYEDCIRYSIACKMGDVNADKQWHLSRLKNGFYPLYVNGDYIEFTEKHNWILRNRVDYNNVLDINYYDIIRIPAETMKILGYTYSIPERKISVGEFGVILNVQNNVPNIIQNKYKVNLRSISKTNNYYWVVGDEGTLLRVNKLTYEIDKISLNTFNNLCSISFFNNLRGFIVGEYNTIFETIDGGISWTPIVIDEFEGFKYNKVIYYNFNKVYIGGDTGIYLELEFANGEWSVYKRTVKKIVDDDDEFDLVDDINDIIPYTWGTTNPWSLTWSGSASFGTISTTKESMILVTNRDNIIVHNINNFIEHEYLYLDYNQPVGKVNTIAANTASFYFASIDDLFYFNINQFQTVGSVSNIISMSGSYATAFGSAIPNINKLYNFNNQSLEIAGDNSELFSATYSAATQSILTTAFIDSLKSKLLFLDYEIAGKLNFFDDNQIYRIPNSIDITAATTSITITASTNEYNWLSYYKDSLKTWSYYTYSALFQLDDTNKIEFSSTFRKIGSTNTLSFTSSSMTMDPAIVVDLAPTINKYKVSNFIVGSASITAPSSPYTIYACDDILVVASNTLDALVGEILLLESSVVKANFMVNRIDIISGIRYFYCYTKLAQNILTELKASTDTITITNLNTFNNLLIDFSTRFNDHPVGVGYVTVVKGSLLTLSPIFNNFTAYYNMGTEVVIDAIPYSMYYQDSFLDFGFKPTYNLLGYLNNIDPITFTASKEFKALPRYSSVPFSDLSGGTSSFNGIYIDTNVGTNKIYFSPSLKNEWETFYKWTFLDVDVNYSANPTVNSEKLLITDKFYDESQDWYVLEFHKKVNYSTGITISTFNVLSRNRLDQISHDLEELSNIQKTKSFKNYNMKFGQDDTTTIPNSWSFSNLQGELNFKFPTDSYALAFTADHDIKESISGIVYVDDNNHLAFNTVRLTQQILADINYLSQDVNGYLIVNTLQEHRLSVMDGFLLTLKPAPGSSYYLNPQYNGYLTVKSIIDKFTFVVDILSGSFTVGDIGTIEHFKKDPFFNYQPVDIIDVGIDKKTKRSVAILPENVILEGFKYKLVNIDLTKFKFNLVDGLSLETIVKKYSWLLEAEIDNAIIGEDENGLVWYMGTWFCGRWFGGTWYSGEWLGGDWYGGTWDSTKVDNKILSAKVDTIVKDRKYSLWKSGHWYAGDWKEGTWYNGTWYNGNWSDGEWFNGIWNDGVWTKGSFIGGTWVEGIWNDGLFSSRNKPAYWLHGKWYGGDFENGIWYGGTWAQNRGKVSRFGTKPSNSRPAIWHGGKWFAGQFHSVLNLDENGKPQVSDRHSYSIWNTGIWMGGDFYGGKAYNIDMRNGKWYGGIMEELPIYGIVASTASTPATNAFEFYGEWRFNNLDTLWIVDNYINGTSSLGTTEAPKAYQVRDVDIDYTVPGKKTTVYVFYQDNTVALPVTPVLFSTLPTGYRIVSHVSKSKWYSGIWENGIFSESEFWGGIWYNGVFDNSKWYT